MDERFKTILIKERTHTLLKLAAVRSGRTIAEEADKRLSRALEDDEGRATA